MKQFIYGKNSVLEVLKSDLPIAKVFLDRKPNFNIPRDISVTIIPRSKMDKMVRGNHQGYICEMKEFNYKGMDVINKDKPSKILILDHIEDPQNFGAIIRSANASGVKHIIIPKNRSVRITPTVLKVSSGGIVGMNIISVNSLNEAVKKLKNDGYWIYASALENGIDYKKASFNDPLVLIVGNEGKGVSSPLLKLSDQIVYIEMNGTVQSLNVSVATGILLFGIS